MNPPLVWSQSCGFGALPLSQILGAALIWFDPKSGLIRCKDIFLGFLSLLVLLWERNYFLIGTNKEKYGHETCWSHLVTPERSLTKNSTNSKKPKMRNREDFLWSLDHISPEAIFKLFQLMDQQIYCIIQTRLKTISRYSQYRILIDVHIISINSSSLKVLFQILTFYVIMCLSVAPSSPSKRVNS